MCRSRLAAALALVVLSVTGALAASPPSGTISCTVAGDTNRPNGNWRLRFSPWINQVPSPGRTLVTTFMQGTCDNAGVSGGKAPITNVQAHLVGKLAAGATCATITSAPVFERLQLKITWQTLDGSGRLRSVAKTSATFVDADWDAGVGGFVFTSGPLKGAFAGSTSTITIALDYPQLLDALCTSVDGIAYGDAGTSSITIP